MTDEQLSKPHKPPHSFGTDFRKFFVRGLAIVLPTALTIWLLVIAYTFVNQNIAGPINAGVRAAIIRFSDWPQPKDTDFIDTWSELPESRRQDWSYELDKRKAELDIDAPANFIKPSARLSDSNIAVMRLEWQKTQPDIVFEARLHAFETKWDSIRIAQLRVLNLIGIVLAIVLIYIAGVIVTSFIASSTSIVVPSSQPATILSVSERIASQNVAICLRWKAGCIRRRRHIHSSPSVVNRTLSAPASKIRLRRGSFT